MHYVYVCVCVNVGAEFLHLHTFALIHLLMRAAFWQAEAHHIAFNFILTLLLMKNINYKLKSCIN